MSALLLGLSLISAVTSVDMMRKLGSQRETRERLHDNLSALRVVKKKLPPLSNNDTVFVDFTFNVAFISEVNDAKLTLQSKIFVTIKWSDEALAWNPSSYGNVLGVSLHVEDIWHPLLSISNMPDNDDSCLIGDTNIWLHNNGSLMMSISCLVKTLCNFDLKYYPFDTQKCKIVYEIDGADASIRTRTDFYNNPQTQTYFRYQMAGDFEILEAEALVQEEVQTMELIITIKRASLYYIICVIGPMVTTSMLTLLVFWIPPSSGEKMSYLVSVYVSTSLFLNFVGDTLPRNMSRTNTPRMAVFLAFVIVECVLALVVTIFIMRRYHDEQEAASKTMNTAPIGTVAEKSVEPRCELATDSFGKKAHGRVHQGLANVALILIGRLNVNKTSAAVLDRIFFWIFLSISVPFYALVFNV